MNYKFWQQTGLIRPFQSIEECEDYIHDCVKIPKIDAFRNASIHKSLVKKGITGQGEKVDSFFEFIFIQYNRLIKGFIVERNHRQKYLQYIDPNGKQRKFYPDFIVNGSLYEVKGYFSEKDRCKKDQHPDVTWCFSDDIKQMREQLDKLKPDWKDDFIQTN